MNEQTKKIIQVLVIIFFLAATIVVVFSMISKGGSRGNVQDDLLFEELADLNKEVMQEKISEEELIFIKNEAEKNCEEIEGMATTTCAYGFYSAKALDDKKISLCNLIEEKFLRTTCLDNIYLSIALGEETNISVCKGLSQKDQQVACSDEANYRLSVQYPEQAQNYCKEIVNEGTKKMCLDRIQR